MFQKLSSTSNRTLWVNTDHILSMETITVEKGYPSTNILFSNGGSELVHESPDDIMTEANRGR
jgi:competence transcription factor ComK